MDISIIVPYYNAIKYFHNLFDSILNQTFKNFELIVVNDGSTDGSLEMLNKLKNKYPFMKVINKQNGGSASARNIGIAEANGKYICMLDSDDIVESTYLELMYSNIIKYDADIAYCNFSYIKSYNCKQCCNEKYDVIEKSNVDLFNEYCEKKTNIRTVVLWNKLFKKSIFDNLNFVEGKGIDDQYLILQLLYRAKKIIHIDQVLYHYYIANSSSQMNQQYSLKKLDFIDAIERNIIFLKSLNNKKIRYEKLYYGYFSSIVINYYYLKKNYERIEIIEHLNYLKKRKKKIYLAFFSRQVSLLDKAILLCKCLVPNFFVNSI